MLISSIQCRGPRGLYDRKPISDMNLGPTEKELWEDLERLKNGKTLIFPLATLHKQFGMKKLLETIK